MRSVYKPKHNGFTKVSCVIPFRSIRSIENNVKIKGFLNITTSDKSLTKKNDLRCANIIIAYDVFDKLYLLPIFQYWQY